MTPPGGPQLPRNLRFASGSYQGRVSQSLAHGSDSGQPLRHARSGLGLLAEPNKPAEVLAPTVSDGEETETEAETDGTVTDVE